MPLRLAAFECTCGLGQKPGQTADFRKPARTKAKKEYVSGETRTYGNPNINCAKKLSYMQNQRESQGCFPWTE